MFSYKAACLGALLAGFVLVGPVSAPTSNELVYFTSGEVMSVAGHRFEQNAVVLQLHGGAEVRCDLVLIERIELDRSPRYSTEPPQLESYNAYADSQLLSRPYGDLVQQASKTHGVDPYLIHAIIEVESSYNAAVQSHRGAMGLMQLMPALAADYAVEDPYDPQTNIDIGTRHLGQLIERYGIAGGLAAYNAGEGSVQRFGGIPPYPETHHYVSRVLEVVDMNQTN